MSGSGSAPSAVRGRRAPPTRARRTRRRTRPRRRGPVAARREHLRRWRSPAPGPRARPRPDAGSSAAQADDDGDVARGRRGHGVGAGRRPPGRHPAAVDDEHGRPCAGSHERHQHVVPGVPVDGPVAQQHRRVGDVVPVDASPGARCRRRQRRRPGRRRTSSSGHRVGAELASTTAIAAVARHVPVPLPAAERTCSTTARTTAATTSPRRADAAAGRGARPRSADAPAAARPGRRPTTDRVRRKPAHARNWPGARGARRTPARPCAGPGCAASGCSRAGPTWLGPAAAGAADQLVDGVGRRGRAGSASGRPDSSAVAVGRGRPRGAPVPTRRAGDLARWAGTSRPSSRRSRPAFAKSTATYGSTTAATSRTSDAHRDRPQGQHRSRKQTMRMPIWIR